MKYNDDESPVERAATAAAWGLMLHTQTRKALNAEANDETFADNNPEIVAMCMQAGSAQQLVRAMDELRRAVDSLE